MSDVKSVSQWMAERGQSMDDLIAAARIEHRVAEAIILGRYTPSPEQRQRLSAALGVTAEQISWGHVAPVEHMYGHGPQFGRSP